MGTEYQILVFNSLIFQEDILKKLKKLKKTKEFLYEFVISRRARIMDSGAQCM